MFKLNKRTKEIEIIHLGDKIDDYGNISSCFKAFTDFPINYWDDDKINLYSFDTNTSYKARKNKIPWDSKDEFKTYWHHSPDIYMYIKPAFLEKKATIIPKSEYKNYKNYTNYKYIKDDINVTVYKVPYKNTSFIIYMLNDEPKDIVFSGRVLELL